LLIILIFCNFDKFFPSIQKLFFASQIKEQRLQNLLSTSTNQIKIRHYWITIFISKRNKINNQSYLLIN